MPRLYAWVTPHRPETCSLPGCTAPTVTDVLCEWDGSPRAFCSVRHEQLFLHPERATAAERAQLGKELAKLVAHDRRAYGDSGRVWMAPDDEPVASAPRVPPDHDFVSE